MSFCICDGDPGPGFWRRDTAHYPSGMSRHLWELLLPAYDIATRRAFSRYGSSIDHIDVVRIRGRVYNRSIYVEDEAELKKRNDAAERAIACKLWRIDQDSWPSIRNELHERLIQLSRQNPESMTAAELLRHMHSVREVFHRGTQTHFDLQPASTYPVGELDA